MWEVEFAHVRDQEFEVDSVVFYQEDTEVVFFAGRGGVFYDGADAV